MQSGLVDPVAVRAARLAAGLSQSQLARRLGVGVINVSRWETGVSSPTPHRLPVVAQALAVPVEGILSQEALNGGALLLQRLHVGLTQAEAAAAEGISTASYVRRERAGARSRPAD